MSGSGKKARRASDGKAPDEGLPPPAPRLADAGRRITEAFKSEALDHFERSGRGGFDVLFKKSSAQYLALIARIDAEPSVAQTVNRFLGLGHDELERHLDHVLRELGRKGLGPYRGKG